MTAFRIITSCIVAVFLGVFLGFAAEWGGAGAAQAQAPAAVAAKEAPNPDLKRWKSEENQEYGNLINEEAIYQAKLEAVQARRQAWILLMRDRYGCNIADWDAISDDKGGAFRKKATNAKKGE